MVIGVQYESDAARQVVVPNLMEAYRQGRMSSIVEKSGQLSNRKAELDIQQAETAAPYAKKRMEQDIAKNDAILSKYSMDQKMAWVQFAKTFIPQAQSPEDLMGTVRAAQDFFDMPNEVAQMALSGMPVDLLGKTMGEKEKQEAFEKYKQQLMYGTQLFEFNLQKEQAKQKHEYDIDLEKERTAGGLQIERERTKRYLDENGNYLRGSSASTRPAVSYSDAWKAYESQYKNSETGEWKEDRPDWKEFYRNESEMFGGQKESQGKYSADELFDTIQEFNLSEKDIDLIFNELQSKNEIDTYYRLDEMLKKSKGIKEPNMNNVNSMRKSTVNTDVMADATEDITENVKENITKIEAHQYKPAKKKFFDATIDFVSKLTGKAAKDVTFILMAAAQNAPDAQDWLRRNVVSPTQRFLRNPSKEIKEFLDYLERLSYGEE